MIITRLFIPYILFMLLGACGGGTNKAPIAIASADKVSLKEGENTYLDASGSYDQDNKVLVYSWSYTHEEKKVKLEGVRPLFVAPEVKETGDTVKIELRVSDNNSISSTDLVLNINNIEVNSHTRALLKACLLFEENSMGSRLLAYKYLHCSLDHPNVLSQKSLDELEKFENLESYHFPIMTLASLLKKV